MARVPSAGGKSRLAPHLSDHRLRAFREALFLDTIETVTGLADADAVVFDTPVEAEDEIRALSSALPPCVPQVGADLGERMHAALDHLLRGRGCEAAMLVGTDIPLLELEHLEDARESLRASGGVVLGPADDGGYYLIGMRTLHAELFRGIEWGTASVLTDTLRAAERAGIEARLTRALYDVDTIEDVRRLENDLREAPALARHVRAWINERS
jgi:hypothetical protein